MVKGVLVVKVYLIARGNPQQASRVSPSSACPTASPSSTSHHHRSRPYHTPSTNCSENGPLVF